LNDRSVDWSWKESPGKQEQGGSTENSKLGYAAQIMY
jgi:hypothetical protein